MNNLEPIEQLRVINLLGQVADLQAKIARTDKIVEEKLKAKYGHLFLEESWAVLCGQCDGGGCARCDETGHGFYASIEDL